MGTFRLLFVVLLLFSLAKGHGHTHGDHHDHHHHSHGHDEEMIQEPAHFKYSRSANEEIPEPKLQPPKAPAAHHGHSHEEHHGHSHEEGHGHSHTQQKGPAPPSAHSHSAPKKIVAKEPLYAEDSFLSFLNDDSNRIWCYSMGSTLLISIAPFLILFMIPIQANTAKHESLLKVLLAFASGGLLGDAFLHLIPHALMAGAGAEKEEEHAHSHAHHGHSHEGAGHTMDVGLYVLYGMTFFLIMEKLGRIFRGEGGHGHSHGGGHSHEDTKKPEEKRKSSGGEVRKRKDSAKKADDEAKEDKKEADRTEEISEPRLKMAAILNLLADFAHNFTDGLAVGASYLAGTPVGIITTLTVLIHEVPHEIGDFAILVQSGFTKKKAILVQLLTAVGALLGCAISLLSSDPSGLNEQAAASWVLPFTAGGFIYIATVTVIPELLEDSGLWQSMKEVFAMFLGILMMVGISYME